MAPDCDFFKSEFWPCCWDSNLNTSQHFLFLFFSGSTLTALFSHELQSREASAWEQLMVVCTSHYLSLAALWCCVEILWCSIRLYTSFHYASLSSNFCDQIRKTISFWKYFWAMICVYGKNDLSLTFFCCWQMLYCFFLYIWGLLQFLSLVLSFILFLDTIF